jgi:hypothetical protein
MLAVDRMLDSSNIAVFHVVLITVIISATLKEPDGLMFHEVFF